MNMSSSTRFQLSALRCFLNAQSLMNAGLMSNTEENISYIDNGIWNCKKALIDAGVISSFDDNISFDDAGNLMISRKRKAENID
jgi:hypothetical protein